MTSLTARRHLPTLLALFGVAICPAPASDGPGTELIADTADEIRLRHRWDTDDRARVQLHLAVPPNGQLDVEILEAHLSGVEEGDTEIRHVFDNPETMPERVTRARAASVVPVGFVRHSRIARLTLTCPTIRLEANEGEPLRVDEVEFAIRFTDTEPFTPAGEDPIARPLIESLVLNPGGVARWATAEPPVPLDVELANWRPTPEPGRWVRLEVSEPGAVGVSLADLEAAGVPRAQVNLEHLALSRRGEPVPLWIDPSGEGFAFAAPDVREPWAPHTVFWLDLAGGQETSRIETVTTAPPSSEAALWDAWVESVIEQDGEVGEVFIVEAAPRNSRRDLGGSQMVWTWTELEVDTPIEIALPPLPGSPGERTGEAEVSVAMVIEQERRGWISALKILAPTGASAEAPLQVHREFHNVADATIDADALMGDSVTLTPRSQTGARGPAASASDGTHRVHLDTVTLRRPVQEVHPPPGQAVALVPPQGVGGGAVVIDMAADALAIDIAAEPPRALAGESLARGRSRVTLTGDDWRLVVAPPADLPRPGAITPWEPADSLSAARRADMVIVTHRELAEAAGRLAEHHRGRGLGVEIVFSDQIYDSHGDGVPGPHPVRAFLADVLRRWEPPVPAYVTILGDCTRDHRGVWDGGVANHVPSFSHANAVASEVYWQASDLRHVLVAGDDTLADFFLGRLSAADPETALAVVDKVIAHAEAAPMGIWRARAGFIADNDRVGASTFDEMCEAVRTEAMIPGLISESVYLRQFPWETNPFIPPELFTRLNEKVSRTATTAVRDLFDEGVLIATYFGHGGPNIWADERMWFGCDSPRSDNLLLTPSGRQAFLINLTCSSGAIDFPDPVYHVCVAEDFLRTPGGPIACFVPTGEGSPSSHHRLTDRLMEAIFDAGLREFGQITAMAGWRVALQGQGAELLEHFVLLGDPALALSAPAQITRRPAEPPTLRRGTAHEIAAELAPETVHDATHGQAWLTDPSGRMVESRDLIPEAGNPTDVDFTIPADADVGSWTASALWWNEETRRDELVIQERLVDEPRFALTHWSVEEAEEPRREGDLVRAEAHLRCVSRLSLPPFEIGVVSLSASPSARVLAQQEVEIAPGEDVQVHLEWPVEEGLHRLALHAPALEHHWEWDSVERAGETFDIATAAAEGSGVLTTGGAHLRSTHPALTPQNITRVQIAVGNVGAQPVSGGHVQLFSDESRGAISRPAPVPSLSPGEVAEIDVPLIRSTQVRQGVGEVHLDWGGSGESAQRVQIPVSLVQERPDVAVVEGSLRVRPNQPSQGQTIFVDAILENRGEIVAQDVGVSLRAAAGGVLQDRADPSAPRPISLRPGERRALTLRWDPMENAGPWELVVVADPDHRIAESDERNNEGTAAVHVQTPEDVRFTRSVGWTSPQLDPPSIVLTTQVSNFGETDAHDYVITWYREQERETEIGETSIEVIRGGATLPIEFLWGFSPDDIRVQAEGGELAPTCEVGMRAGMRRVAPPEQGDEVPAQP